MKLGFGFFFLTSICSSCRWVLLEVLEKFLPGTVNWKVASKPPIKMPFRRVENCNQVISIAKDMNLSLVNIAGNDIVQGNKKLVIGETAQLCRSWLKLIFPIPIFIRNTKVGLSTSFTFCNVPFIYLKWLLVAITNVSHLMLHLHITLQSCMLSIIKHFTIPAIN